MNKYAADYAAKRQREKERAAGLAARILPRLAKDPDWPLATGAVKPEPGEYRRFLRAITRLTKLAVRALHPACACRVRRDRGTAYGWVLVEVTLPESDRSREDEDRTRLEDVLLALGIRYSSYTPDFGPGLDDPQPCLSVTINGAG